MANLGYMQLVRHCNQYCRICSNPETPYVLDLDTARREIDDFAARGYKGVILTGGEPSLSDIVVDIVQYAKQRSLDVRMITNGSKLADEALAKSYLDVGLAHYHVSLYSSRETVHDYITCVKGSHALACKAIKNLGMLGATVHINSVINRFNADHLDELAQFVIHRFPFVRHMVWNNLDPCMGRADTNRECVHTLSEIQAPLFRALSALALAGKTFRVERMPLCFMVEYAWASTETRKIIKYEERLVHFLDAKGSYRQTSFRHEKPDVCSVCTLDSICAGLYSMGKGYEAKELAPVFVNKDTIIRKVRGE
jgi:MoaA/NifB/PqqE/SkfB family radical SAM enzyme